MARTPVTKGKCYSCGGEFGKMDMKVRMMSMSIKNNTLTEKQYSTHYIRADENLDE